MKYIVRKIVSSLVSIVPWKMQEFIYNVIFGPKYLRKLINMILKFTIPPFVTLKEGVIFLNRQDPRVAGMMALGAYENFESNLFRKSLGPGMVVADLGANLGHYTVIAARLTGPAGKVIAFEPDKENILLLSKTLRENEFTNVFCVQKAVSNVNDTSKLFIAEENKGHHSLFASDASNTTVPIETITLDSFFKTNNVGRVHVIKIDIEGAEALALEGMAETLREYKPTLFIEFFPNEIEKAKRNPVALLESLDRLGYKIFNINETDGRLEQIKDFAAFRRNIPMRLHTNLYCKVETR